MTRQKETVKWKTTRNKKREKKKTHYYLYTTSFMWRFQPSWKLCSSNLIISPNTRVLQNGSPFSPMAQHGSPISKWSRSLKPADSEVRGSPLMRTTWKGNGNNEPNRGKFNKRWRSQLDCLLSMFQVHFFLEMHNLMSWLFHWCLESTVYAGLYLVLTIWQLSMTCHVFAYVFLPVVIEFVAWLRCCGFH